FWGPSIICAFVAIGMAISVKETPEEHGYLPVEDYAGGRPGKNVFLFGLILTVLLVSVASWIGWLYHTSRIGPMDLGVIVIVFIIAVFILIHILAARNPPPPLEVLAPPIVAPADPPNVEVVPAGSAVPLGYVSAVRNPKAYDERATRADIQVALRTIVRNPAVWIVAAAYACTGAVRNPIDSWFARYMQEAQHTSDTSSLFQVLAFLIPCAGSAGSLLSGYISDKLFAGARSPIAAALYGIETCFVALAVFFVKSPQSAVFFLVALSFTANATHSILGTAAAMDIGGRKMTGFASGLIDSFQYFGATLGLWALGHLLDRYGWRALFPYMIPFGVIGFLLMVFGRGIIARGSKE
ncbi:MAG TPA: MFS transporter, partial [Tepidisphaeraceae bacterium]|nr:MFS transporter [Tepidisphaeraceae bacterium]